MAYRSSFHILGICLLVSGAFLALTSHFVLSFVPFTALGISTIILAAISFALARGQPRVPPEISSMLLEAGLDNTAALIEELGIGSKAVYLPSPLAGGSPRAFLAVSPRDSPRIERALPNRLIVRYGRRPDEMGILVTTLGTAAVRRFAHLGLEGTDIEGSLSSVMTGSTDLAEGVRVVQEGPAVNVEVRGPKLDHRRMKIFENIGSPIASVVASVVAECTGSPVTITGEEAGGGKHVVRLNVGAGATGVKEAGAKSAEAAEPSTLQEAAIPPIEAQ